MEQQSYKRTIYHQTTKNKPKKTPTTKYQFKRQLNAGKCKQQYKTKATIAGKKC